MNRFAALVSIWFAACVAPAVAQPPATSQKPNGGRVNDADRWMEGQPALTTAYSLLALQAAYPP